MAFLIAMMKLLNYLYDWRGGGLYVNYFGRQERACILSRVCFSRVECDFDLFLVPRCLAIWGLLDA